MGYRQAAMTHRSFSARADIEAILAARAAQRVDVPVLQPADPFLDTAGEQLRRRIFMTGDEAGRAMCLRPEFTIPVCHAHLEAGAGKGRYCYVGTVFRQRRAGGNEFLQAGIEDIGATAEAAADARSINDALAVLDALGVSNGTTILLGDQSVFDAVLEALDLPRGWRLQLAHAFGNTDALEATLAKLADPPPMPVLPDDVGNALKQGADALEAALAQRMADAKIIDAGSRSPQDIAARLMAKVQAAQTRPKPEALETLRAFLSLSVPLSQAVDALDSFGSAHGLTLNGNRERFAERVVAIVDAGLALDAITYDASFGRALDYYTGLVFEVRGRGGDVLVGGGRYDRLLTMLGAAEPMPGIGFSVWLDRVAGAAS